MAKKGRGTRTHGHGKTHRGKGEKGGKGYAGTEDHRWILTIKGGKLLLKLSNKRGKYGHFGKRGFSRGKLRREYTTVNLSWVDRNFAPGATVNLAEMGIEKLLGAGKLTKPLTIIVERWSKKAEEKVTAAGGKLVKPSTVA